MPAMTPPIPAPAIPVPRRKRGRPRSTEPPKTRPPRPRRPRGEMVDRAVEVLAAMATLHPTPDLGQLAGSLGWPAEDLRATLGAMERSGLVESWADPTIPGATRVMLSARSLNRLGLVLAPRGDRWNLDRPPPARANHR